MEKQKTIADDIKAQVNFLHFLAQTFTAPMQAILLRKPGTCGDRFFVNTPAFCAFPLLLIFSAFPGGEGVLCVLALYPVGLLSHRIRQNHTEHSMSEGQKRFGRAEGGVLLLLAMLATPLPALSMYFLLTAFSTGLEQSMMKARDKAIARRMRDAEIEGRYYGG